MTERLESIYSCGEVEVRGDRLNAYLGISFSKFNYFSHPTLERYLHWMGARYDQLLVVIADQLESHNYQVFRGLTADDALVTTRRIGEERRERYQSSACPAELRGRTRFVLASELLEESPCADMLAVTERHVSEDDYLRAAIRETVSRTLLTKLQAAELFGDRKATAIDTLERYLIEEIAIILHLTLGPYPRYDVSIFPYPPPRILIDLYEGVYEGPIAEITRGLAYRAQQVVPACAGKDRIQMSA